jgi:RNA polymerase sigma-70 factor (sigma-E family)
VSHSDQARQDEFRAYVLRSRGRLLRTATLLASGDATQAEDLVQTVLLRMYVSWPRIRPDTRDAYTRKMLVNAHLDERRRPYARHERNHAQVPDVAVESAAPANSDAAVFRALAELPPRMRAAVILRHLHEASVAETADVLRCSEGTVKSQTARGLAHLRARLAELSDEIADDGIDDAERSHR